MNRIVREHYPVSKLPEDLREGFGPDDEVRVTVDAPQGDQRAAPEPPWIGPIINRDPAQGAFHGGMVDQRKPHLLSRLKQLRRANFASDAEADTYVGTLRDDDPAL